MGLELQNFGVKGTVRLGFRIRGRAQDFELQRRGVNYLTLQGLENRSTGRHSDFYSTRFGGHLLASFQS